VSWFKTGYEATEHAYDDLPDQGPRRVWMPAEATNQFLFLDDEPFCFWEHQFQMNGNWLNWEPCKVRNKMEATCSVCDRFPDRYSSFIGYHSVTALTPWTSDKGLTYCFGRQMYGAKLGGKDKPGVLKELQRLRDKAGGRMRGLIIECYRSGKKSETVGDKLEVVDQIEPDAIVAWVKQKLVGHLELYNEQRETKARDAGKLDNFEPITMEKFLGWNPIEPFDFEEIIKPRTNAQLLTGLGGGSGGGGSEKSSGEKEEGGLDEDIPY